MMRRQFARTQGVFMGDVERTDGPGTQRTRNELRRRLWKRQRTEGKFDGDFPRAGGREIQLLGRRGQEVFGPQIEFVLGQGSRERRSCRADTSCVLLGFSGALLLSAFE